MNVVLKMTDEQIMGIVEAISEIESDSTVPKNIKKKLGETARILKNSDDEELIRISKAISELEEVVDDQNMQSYTRTQLLNILSMLEMIY